MKCEKQENTQLWYLTASSQSEASSQEQDDVPGHSLMDQLPVEQSGRRSDLLTCVRHETVTTLKEQCPVMQLSNERRSERIPSSS